MQEEVFLLYKAVTGVWSTHQLAPVDCPTAGYNVSYLKEQAISYALYLIPLNSNINVTPITVNDISVGLEAQDCQCSNCYEIISLRQSQEHKMLCTQKKEEVENGRMCKK